MIAGEVKHEGFVKLRLVHTRGRSIVLPDHVVVTGQSTYWLQPQWVYPSLLWLNDPGYTPVYFAPANRAGHDQVLRLEIAGDGFVANLPDRSQVYACKVVGPPNVNAFAAGRARVREDGGFDLRLYHHTTREAKRLISASGTIRGSAWNIQGTRELANVAYAYLTSLDRVVDEADLVRMAMAGRGNLPLRLDQAPDNAPPDVVLKVYKSRLKDRAHRVPLWVPAEHVAPSHVYQHTTGVVEYEMAHPWIYRIPLEPGTIYAFKRDRAEFEQAGLKRFDYVVIGDCTTREGLQAVYDEEDTTHTFEIQDLGGQTVFEFWLEHGNTELFTGSPERQSFAT